METPGKLIGFAVVLFLVAGLRPAAATELTALSSRYEQTKQQLAATYAAAVQSSLLIYSNALTAAEVQLVDEGNAQALRAVRREKARFAEAGEVPKTPPDDLTPLIHDAQIACKTRTRQAEQERARNLKTLARQYLSQLNTLKKYLTTQDKIDGAVQVLTEMKKIEAAFALPPPAAQPPSKPAPATNVVFLARNAVMSAGSLRYVPEQDTIGYWLTDSGRIAWPLKNVPPGNYDVFIEYATRPNMGGVFTVEVGRQSLDGTTTTTGDAGIYTKARLGRVTLRTGADEIAVVGQAKHGVSHMNVRSLELKSVNAAPAPGDTE